MEQHHKREREEGMKRYDELTASEQAKAVDKALTRIMEGILEGSLRFSDEKNKDTLQASIDRACEKAEAMHTPWFASEYIMDEPYKGDYLNGRHTVGDTLRGMAQCDAEDSLYAEPGEWVVSGIIEEERVTA
jgi:hypothetical protein